ncbi:MAG: hypothetical protein ACREUZ_06025 [Burkholderiales bacterium]
MPEDLTTKIIQEYDSAEFQPGGGVRNTTVVRFMVGRFGPFEHVFDRNPSRYDKQGAMDAKKAALEGLT